MIFFLFINHACCFEPYFTDCFFKLGAFYYTGLGPISEEVEKYFTEIEEMLQDPPIPPLLINFDETGFGRRPEKGKRKTEYVSKKCEVKPFWREQQDLHHISVVTAITAFWLPLRYMCLSTRITSDDDLEDTFF